MSVLISLIVSIIIALIIAKILNRKFYPIWLCVCVTIGAIAVSILIIKRLIVEYEITNESMLYLIGAIMCWIGAVTTWRSEI